MTLGELEALFRSNVKDTVKPYLFGTTEVWNWLNEAQEEGAVRADLLPESSDADFCEIDVTAGTSSYALNPLITRVTYATFTPAASGDDDEPQPLKLALYADNVELDRIRRAWRTTTEQPRDVIVQRGLIRVGCLPDTDGTLRLECFRMPLDRMAKASDSPEVQATHHRHLVKWAEHRAFSVPDAETRDPSRAAAALVEFEGYFGMRPDADQLQAIEARPAYNKAIW